mmetsp:Transcript_20978/g.67983  ORF Transcript_20978/g.67983 Transcript_20978/m.67983 type:complete len:268 (+) Transcript_20978:144-947(+)
MRCWREYDGASTALRSRRLRWSAPYSSLAAASCTRPTRRASAPTLCSSCWGTCGHCTATCRKTCSLTSTPPWPPASLLLRCAPSRPRSRSACTCVTCSTRGCRAARAPRAWWCSCASCRGGASRGWRRGSQRRSWPAQSCTYRLSLLWRLSRPSCSTHKKRPCCAPSTRPSRRSACPSMAPTRPTAGRADAWRDWWQSSTRTSCSTQRLSSACCIGCCPGPPASGATWFQSPTCPRGQRRAAVQDQLPVRCCRPTSACWTRRRTAPG